MALVILCEFNGLKFIFGELWIFLIMIKSIKGNQMVDEEID